MFALSIFAIFLAVCMVALDIMTYVIADHVEKLERELEEMKKEKR
jgi:cell division protein FtsL